MELDPGPPPTNVTTSYTYDVLNHLTVVSMPRGSSTQTRTFNYNTGATVTGFLQSATNPENGTVSYTYNSSNLLASKTDAKNQQFTYQYDIYNRLYTVTLGASQVLRTYIYDVTPVNAPNGFVSQYALGRLTGVVYPLQANGLIQMADLYSYTQAGLPAAKQLQIYQNVAYLNSANQPAQQWVTGDVEAVYSYNGEGQITSVGYPYTNQFFTYTYGPVYNYSYDSMHRLSGMTDSNNNTIVSNVSYNAANRLLTMNYPAANETRSYNVLNQLTNVTAGSGENLTYNYPTNGTNNGKVSSMYNAVSGETVTYTYDSLNRLLTANGSGWGQQYGFDGFGNLLSKTVTAGSGPSLSVSVNAANNQIQGVSGLSYDANGNASNAPGMVYDAENRLIGTTGLQYAYDAQNERIWSWNGQPDGLGNPTGYTVNMYSPTGQKLGAYLIAPATENGIPVLNQTLASSDQYFGGRRLAVMDQLGSVGTYFPWGEDKGGTNPQDTFSFATYWQDSASGLDYANNRYYSNAYGRFMTPDPLLGERGSVRSPELEPLCLHPRRSSEFERSARPLGTPEANSSLECSAGRS